MNSQKRTAASIALASIITLSSASAQDVPFLRGDLNKDGGRDGFRM